MYLLVYSQTSTIYNHTHTHFFLAWGIIKEAGIGFKSWLGKLWHIWHLINHVTNCASNSFWCLILTYIFKHACMCVKSLQSYPTLCDFMDCSPPGSSVHGLLQARILECVAMPSSRGVSQPRDGTRVSYVSFIGRQVLYHYHHLGSPALNIHLIIMT